MSSTASCKSKSKAELPTFAPSSFLKEYHQRAGLPPPPAATRSWPPGTRVAFLRSGVEVDYAEIVSFQPPGAPCPPGVEDDLIADPTQATYVLNFTRHNELGLVPCEELHDPGEWRRLDKTTSTTCTNCEAPDASLKCAACRGARYCNRTCQRAHWVIHKPRCIRARGGKVDAKLEEAAEAAMQEREQEATVKLLAGQRLVAPDVNGRVVVGSGLFLGFDNFHRRNLEAALKKAGLAYDCVDISKDEDRKQLAKDCCAGKVRMLILLGVGCDGNTEVLLNDKFFKAALMYVAKEGGWVVMQGEGPPMEQLLERCFGKTWKTSHYSRFDIELNPKWVGGVAKFSSLSGQSTRMKTVALSNVPEEERLFCDGEATMMAAGRFEKGWIGFVGDVNALETPTNRAYALLARMARS